MDNKSKFNTDRLTHVLTKDVGWIPVQDGKYETVESPTGTTFPTRVWFLSEGKTIVIDSDRIVGFKYAAPSEVRR